MKYRDTVAITRASTEPGTQDPVTGAWTGPPPVAVYTGQAAVQAGGLIRANRRSTSQIQNEADGVVFLPPWEQGRVMDIAVGDNVHIDYAPVRQGNSLKRYGADAEVTFVRPEDRGVLVKYL